jgi:hypothetical protein
MRADLGEGGGSAARGVARRSGAATGRGGCNVPESRTHRGAALYPALSRGRGEPATDAVTPYHQPLRMRPVHPADRNVASAAATPPYATAGLALRNFGLCTASFPSSRPSECPAAAAAAAATAATAAATAARRRSPPLTVPAPRHPLPTLDTLALPSYFSSLEPKSTASTAAPPTNLHTFLMFPSLLSSPLFIPIPPSYFSQRVPSTPYPPHGPLLISRHSLRKWIRRPRWLMAHR